MVSGNFLLIFVLFQIHPGAFKQGGIPLVACCVSAAEQANVSAISYTLQKWKVKEWINKKY
jgi:hypothetical protein